MVEELGSCCGVEPSPVPVTAIRHWLSCGEVEMLTSPHSPCLRRCRAAPSTSASFASTWPPPTPATPGSTRRALRSRCPPLTKHKLCRQVRSPGLGGCVHAPRRLAPVQGLDDTVTGAGSVTNVALGGTRVMLAGLVRILTWGDVQGGVFNSGGLLRSAPFPSQVLSPYQLVAFLL